MEKNRKNIQVMIAHPRPEEQKRIASLLKREGVFRVRHMTHDGLECLREAVAIQPDLLVLDLVLDKIDGLEVLRRLKEFPLPNTKCLILSDYNGYIAKQALLHGADYCLLTPCADHVLIERIRMLVLPPLHAYTDEAIDVETIRVLRAIGVSNHLKAYAYVLDGVRILIRDPDVIRQRRLTKDLYGVIAQHFDISTLQVERTMRTLTESLFKKGDSEHLANYFNASDIQRGKITNSNFLAVVVYQVSKALEENSAADKHTEY